MSQLSDYMEQTLINQIFRGGTALQPTSVHVALCTAAPTDASTGSTITEPTTGGYARIAVVTSPTGSSRWSDPGATGGLTDNLDALTWTNNAATVWNITHVAICSAATGGNVLYYGPITNKSVAQNDQYQIAVGALDLSLA